jgi:hypothetical protein
MKNTFFAIIAASFLTGSLAYANCSDEILVNCGKFQLESTVCNSPGDKLTSTSSLFALYGDGNEVALEHDKRKSGEDLDVYRGVVNSDEDIYLEESHGPDLLNGGTKTIYSTYTVSWGVKSTVSICADIKGQTAGSDAGAKAGR